MAAAVVRPSNALIFVTGARRGELPDLQGGAIVSNDRSILVPCQASVDGDVELTLEELDRPGAGAQHVAALVLPDRILALRDTDGRIWLSSKIASAKADVWVWTDPVDYPARVRVGFLAG